MENLIDRRFAAKIENYPGESVDIANLYADIAARPPEDQKIILAALDRYDREGENQSYSSDPSALIAYLVERGILAGVHSVVDLGGGAGNLVRGLAEKYPDLALLGIDLSPSFVRGFNADKDKKPNTAMRLGLIDSPALPERLGPFTEGAAISVLTLDRVADPRQLIANMARFKGPKILSTILPIQPEDDDPTRQDQKIIYTRPEMRVVPGTSAEEDLALLTETVNRAWGGGVEVVKLPITGSSSGDAWQYTLYTFIKK